jgi:hypothetical protein
LARECEGLEVWVNASDGAICDFQDDSIPHYLTDPAAAIRAAEAWQLKDARKRNVEIRWCGGLKIAELMDYSDDAAQLRTFGNGSTVAAALAQALYRATGGTA